MSHGIDRGVKQSGISYSPLVYFAPCIEDDYPFAALFMLLCVFSSLYGAINRQKPELRRGINSLSDNGGVGERWGVILKAPVAALPLFEQLGTQRRAESEEAGVGFGNWRSTGCSNLMDETELQIDLSLTSRCFGSFLWFVSVQVHVGFIKNAWSDEGGNAAPVLTTVSAPNG